MDGGERGCTSQNYITHRPLCKMVVFIVHQLYKCTLLYRAMMFVYPSNGLFPIHVNEIASTVDDQNKFSLKKTKGNYMH